LAVERDVEKGGPLTTCNLLFDESGYFLLYATLLGIKVVNLWTNKLVRTIGKPENLRLLYFALFQEMNMFAKTFRFSIVSNLRFSNKRAVLDNFSLPNLGDFSNLLSGAKVFSVFDLKKTYNLKVHLDC
ncbi:hypothetical protein Avbf_04033, partial [Armadillidium vulgare]